MAQQAPSPSVDKLALEPPRLLEAPPPEYPPARIKEGLHPTVMIEVVLSETGQIMATKVEHSAGADFDRAALQALRSWKFAPARQGDQPVASRVHVAVHFELPLFDLATTEPGASGAARDEHPPTHMVADPHLKPVPKKKAYSATARVDPTTLRTENRSSSHFRIDSEVLRAAPHAEGAEILRSAPGVYIARSEGDAVAHNIMLRGFDAEHGQDLELRVGGLPINLPSHIHSQGYADLGFLMSEVVQNLRITEGVYDPRQGDFAVAGTVDFDLGVKERGVLLKSGYGSFNTFRQLALWAPPDLSSESFGAVQYRRTDGFGQNRAGQSASGIFQHTFGSKRWRYRALGVLYGSRADMAGVLRKDDIDAGSVGFYDVYPLPTAQKQNALSGRLMAGLTAEYRGTAGDNAEAGAWLSYDNFQLHENFTGFTQRSQTLENVSGRGDLIAQNNRTTSLGLHGRYRTAPYRPASWAQGTLELGLTGRMDSIDQTQALLDAAVHNQIWDKRVDAQIQGVDLGMWGDLDWSLTPFVNVRAGLRADALYYDVNDKLGNLAPLTRPDDTYITGFERTSFGLAWGPRASTEIKLQKWVSLLGAYGEGYRSPQARTLEDGEQAPFTKVRSGDVGVRMRWDERLELSLTGFYTWLSDDIAFDASEGRAERIGETRRAGTVLYAKTQPYPWLLGAASITYVDAELLEPPPATAQNPQPAFKEGQNLPYIPPLVLRLDLGAKGRLVRDVYAADLRGRAGIGYSLLSSRPLPHGDFASVVSLFDASVGVGWRNVELGLEIFNLFDDRYAALEYNFVSNWNPSGMPSRVPARHISAGAPRTIMATLEIRL